MKILIKGLNDDRYERPLSLISDLFFEETEVFFSENQRDNIDIVIELNLKDADGFFAVNGEISRIDREVTSHHQKDLSDFSDEKVRFKKMKQAVSYVYLSLLQEYTGITQKWGILTGVRPTKLMHKKLQQGEEKERIHQQLLEDYLITEEKIALMQEIVDRQLSVVPDLYQVGDEVSIYIGIPFCPTKCAYCTFPAYAINGKQGNVDSFLGGLHHEIGAVGAWLKEKGIKITTVYYGGGTPTSITAEEMDLLYERMYNSFPDMENVREVTVEAGRPDTITPEKLKVLKKWNIDRISINPQSYIQDTLKAIGRHHTVEETVDKFHLAREMGMNNINMDLIIGLPGEGVKEFGYTLNETEKLMPESLTVHTLSFKRASEMTKNKQRYKVADRTEISCMMDMATEWTRENGYVPYYLYRQKNILGNLENVGYALPGQDSIYNIMIMEELQSIIGLGCGASSKFVNPVTGKITRFANPKDPKSYNDGYLRYTDEKIRILEELFAGVTSKEQK